MSLRLPCVVFLAVAVLVARLVPASAAPPDRSRPTAIVFKLRPSAAATAASDLVAERLTVPRRRDAHRPIADLRPLFVPPAPGAGDVSRSPELARVYVVDVPSGLPVDD